MKSHTQFRVMHVTYEGRACCTYNSKSAVVPCVYLWWYVMLQDCSKNILCLCIFCKYSAWSRTVYQKKEWLHGCLQIRICAQWCCINAELVMSKLHSLRLRNISCALVTEESISILVSTATNQISCDNELKMLNWRNTALHCWKGLVLSVTRGVLLRILMLKWGLRLLNLEAIQC